MSLNGGLENFIGYAINGEVLKGKLTIDAPMIDANQFLSSDSDSASLETNDSSEMAAVQIPENLDISFTGNVGVLKYETYDLSNCGAKITVKDGKLNIEELRAVIWGSKFAMDQTQYSYTPGSQPVLNTNIALINLNARNIINETGIIDKLAPALKDVNGLMSLNFQLNTKFTESMDIDLGSLISSGLVNLTSGEIQLPTWLHQVYDQFNWDYGNISVKPAKIRYSIEDGKLNVKDSIGLNLPKGGKMNLAGNVSLDQQILFGGTLQAEGKKVPFTITGTVKDPVFKLDWKKFGKEEIKKAKRIANPGCFATAIQLAILPLAANSLVKDAIHVNAVTGATGAGTALSATTHFTWRVDNFSHYKAFNHQHLGEIHQSVDTLQEGLQSKIHFIPNRGNFSRGIFATTYIKFEGSIEKAKEIYHNYYKDAAFTFVSDNDIHMKQVVNTNKCLLHLEVHDGKLLITSVIDNLLKGASGQAVHNMNLMFGYKAHLGLQLKANYF